MVRTLRCKDNVSIPRRELEKLSATSAKDRDGDIVVVSIPRRELEKLSEGIPRIYPFPASQVSIPRRELEKLSAHNSPNIGRLPSPFPFPGGN